MNAVELIIGVLKVLKQIHDDVEFSNEHCKHLVKHCEELAIPVNQIKDNYDLIRSNSLALQSVFNLLTDCRTFCEKFRQRSFYQAITHHNRDKEKFIELHRRLDSATHSFSLQLQADLAFAMQDREQKAKAQRDHTNEMLMKLLQAQGKEKEFLSLPKNKRREYLDSAMMMSNNLRDLTELHVSDFNQPRTQEQKSSMNTKLSVLNSLVEDIDYSMLRHWGRDSPDLRRRLGTGSFGTVYKVEYSGKEVALKHFACLADPHVKPSERDKRLIRREACILQHCASHRNVIGFFGVDLEAGIMLMELAVCSLNAVIYGREHLFPTLPDELDKEFLTTFAFKASVVNDIASALHFLHLHNVIHRDIKSSNIIMVITPPTGLTPMMLTPKLSDFGLAFAAGHITSTAPSTVGTVGTLPYNSPEILNSPAAVPEYTPAVDMYALGVLANEMFTGQAPWAGVSQGAIVGAVCYQMRRPELYVPPPDEPLQKSVMDTVVGDATCGCLSQEPEKRPTSRFLSYESDLLRRASVRTHRVTVPASPGAAAAVDAPRPPDDPQEYFQAFDNEQRRLKKAVEDTSEVKKDPCRGMFFEDLCTYYKNEMIHFEIFAIEAAEILQIMNHSVGEEDLVDNIMLPVYKAVHDYVGQHLSDPVYQHDPKLLLQEVERLSEGEIKRMMDAMGAAVSTLHAQMMNAASEGTIVYDESSLRVPKLVRIMLRTCSLAAVSEPKCSLVPAPGDRIPFKRHYNEVFSPGAKLNGSIQENDVVQVVCPGLFIQGLNEEATISAQSLLQCSVRRLMFGPPRQGARSCRVDPTDLRTDFQAAFQNFEPFACDAIECLGELHYDNATDMFVALVMGPVYQSTLRWVNEQRTSKPAYASQPNLLLLDIKDLEEREILTMLERLGPKVVELHNIMLNAAAKNIIADSLDSLRIPKIIRFFLKMHAMAWLSEPKLKLEPPPGFRMAFKAGTCAEILSPGVRMYGRIKEGDPVEVVLCGVENESATDTRPTIPCLVRRLLLNTPHAAKEVPVKQTDVRQEFEIATRNFDPFACDAVDCLVELGETSPAQTFVWRVMQPLHAVAERYVREHKGLKVSDIAALEASNIDALMNEAEPMLVKLHTRMVAAAAGGRIEDKSESLRIPELLRRMLRLHALARLSDPPCFLLPAPGTAISCKDSHCSEILSPGARIYGRIREGDRVETVLCGLYFEPPGGENAKPMVRSLVRRLSTGTSSKSGKSPK